MSRSDRHALKILIFLLQLSEMGHYFQYKEEIRKLLDNLICYYRGEEGTKFTPDMQNEFMKFYKVIEDKIEEMKVDSNAILMLSLTIAVSEYFLSKIKDQKKVLLWSQLIAYSRSQLSRNYTNFTKELDMAAEVSDLMTEALVKVS